MSHACHDKLDKIGRDKVHTKSMSKRRRDKLSAPHILDVVTCHDGTMRPVEKLSQYKGMNKTFDRGLDELETVTRLCGFRRP
jgi:hypothetical protein